MPLGSGARLGPYEIVGAIGAGGMGEVYKATDTRLDRAVAIKILPAHVAADPDLKRRFEREARTLAALSHPHICPVFDVGRQRLRPERGAEPPSESERGWGPASGEDAIDFLVMEYLDGETLAARLAAGALPIAQALRTAVQVADALAAAHRAGIVHRDLKPGNIMLARTGAKLLDFGLAKGGAQAVAGTLSMLPTTPPGLTAQGTILGTFQYMAPEQLEGREADARTDLFAFGAVLYEMLTGRKAFEGKSQASLIGAILKDTPPPPSSLQPLVPRTLDRVVQICLAKDPDDRWQSARDLHRELTWMAEGGADAVSLTTADRSARQLWRARLVAAIFAAAFAVSIGLLVSARLDDGTAIDGPPIRFTVSTQAARPDLYSPGGFALSPDGRSLAYVDGAGPTYTLFVRSIDALESRALVTGEALYSPFWSPDGRFIAFFTADALRKVTVADGTTQTIGALPHSALWWGGTWGPDDVILFAWGRAGLRGGLHRIPASGGTPTPLARDESTSGASRWPQFLPGGGGRFLYTVSSPVVEEDGVYLASLDGRAGDQPVRVMSSDYPAQYAEPGYLLFVRDGVLLAQPFDAGTGSLGGAPVTIAPRVAVSPNVNFRSAELSVSAAGALAYQTGWVRSRLTWLDRRGNVERVLGEPDDYVEADLSPDGTQIALEVNEENGFGEIWLMDAARGTRVPLTRTPDQWEYSPRWSPDGRYVAFSNLAAVHTQLADRSGAAELLGVTSPSPTLQFLRQWTGDGRILFTRLDGGLFSMPASPNGEPAPLPGSGASESQARVSPDGRWLAYTSTETGRREVYVRPVEGGPSRLISTAGGGHPLWHRDGRELYYLASDGTIVAAPVTRGSTLEVGMPKPLFKTRPSQDELRQAYSTVDGERFLVRTLDETTAPAIAWLVNWRALIER